MSVKGRFFRTVVYAGGAAAATYFFDPERGQARRAQAREQLEATLRQAGLSESSFRPAGGSEVLDLRDAPGPPAPDEVEARQASPAAPGTTGPTPGPAVE